jgi:hypothetical protein
LLRWLEKAIKWARIQGDALADMERGIPQDQLARWKKMVANWDADHSKPNPYEEREEGENGLLLPFLFVSCLHLSFDPWTLGSC